MKKIALFVLFLFAASFGTNSLFFEPICPFDGDPGFRTVDIQVINGQVYYVYQCGRGHKYLVKQ